MNVWPHSSAVLRIRMLFRKFLERSQQQGESNPKWILFRFLLEQKKIVCLHIHIKLTSLHRNNVNAMLCPEPDLWYLDQIIFPLTMNVEQESFEYESIVSGADALFFLPLISWAYGVSLSDFCYNISFNREKHAFCSTFPYFCLPTVLLAWGGLLYHVPTSLWYVDTLHCIWGIP